MTIKVNLKIFLFLIIFYLTKQIELYVILMFFAFLHEMGHLICGICLGLKPKALKIMPVGLSVEFQVQPEEYNQKIKKGNQLEAKKILIALAGPVTNFLLILILSFFQNQIPPICYQEMVYSNLLIAFFNLIPIYPLDGGRIMNGLAHILKGKKNSYYITNQISNITMIVLTAVSSIAIYYYQNVAILIIIAYLWGITMLENKRYKMKRRIYKIIENS